MKRRAFLLGLAAVSVTGPALPAVAADDEVARLTDLIKRYMRSPETIAAVEALIRRHATTNYLQELIDRGDPIPPGTYRITRPLVVGPGQAIWMQHSHVLYEGDAALEFREGGRGSVTDNVFERVDELIQLAESNAVLTGRG